MRESVLVDPVQEDVRPCPGHCLSINAAGISAAPNIRFAPVVGMGYGTGGDGAGNGCSEDGTGGLGGAHASTLATATDIPGRRPFRQVRLGGQVPPFGGGTVGQVSSTGYGAARHHPDDRCQSVSGLFTPLSVFRSVLH